MTNVKVGDIVLVGPNMKSLHAHDHKELPWKGKVIRVGEQSIGVEPVDGGLARDVLFERITL